MASKAKAGALKKKKFVDLFAGIGGFHLAMKSIGMECVMASEWDKHAAAVYEVNHGIKPVGDITKINEKDVPEHTILCGGFPCQAFSVSGKQRGFEDTRGTLFFDVARIAREKKPEALFLENVRNFARHDGGKTLKVVEKTLEDAGYEVFHEVFNAAELGFPTARQRIYIVAFRKDTNAARFFSFPEKTGAKASVASCLLTDMSKKDEERLRIKGRHKIDRELDSKTLSLDSPKETPVRVGVIGAGGQGNRIYSTGGVGITLSAYGGGKAAKTGAYLVDGKPRKLHQRECARLMGFPETFVYDARPSQAYKQFGNSVVVGVVSAIARKIDEAFSAALSKDKP